MAQFPARHILFVIVPGWGHLIPALAVAFKLLKENPNLVITFPIAPVVQKKFLGYVEQYIMDEKDDALPNNLRIIPMGPLTFGDDDFHCFVQEFENFYSTLISNKSYTAFNGQILMPMHPPDMCMMDSLNSEAIQTVNRLTKNVLVFALSFGSTALTLRMILRGDVPAQAERLSRETGRPLNDILSEFYEPNKGEVVHIPGLFPMYDYEIVPHLTRCNGIITTSNRIYESEGLAALTDHLAKTNRRLYAIGPLGLTTPDQISREPSPSNLATTTFLDKMLTIHGERSLIYISFGSIFWPRNVDAVWKILEILVENNVPLATGWFLTHGGQNSVMEALSNGIPMIAWPVDTDQPLNAAYISTKLNVAYELMEVRTKNGLKPLYRGITPRGTMDAIEEEFRDILQKLHGSDGEEKRNNAQEFQRKFQTLWEEKGESRKELLRFITDYLS
ncbi:hypothetical protein Clacol_007013 [Clathrus columnatus]|uniref:Uncharacterized protein n=1 Tax=Clathrus columnatus TaxID=1419009 RepID=A0AAV5AH01_9AGAM|nr:hypothetical protein Clacol_007013 [Clathrus columnatus]